MYILHKINKAQSKHKTPSQRCIVITIGSTQIQNTYKIYNIQKAEKCQKQH